MPTCLQCFDVLQVINPSCRQSRSFMEKDHSFGGMPLTYDAQLYEVILTLLFTRQNII